MFPIIRGAEHSLELIDKFKNDEITKEELIEDLEFIQKQIQARGIEVKYNERFRRIAWIFISRAIVKISNCTLTKNNMCAKLQDGSTIPTKKFVKKWAENILDEEGPWNSVNNFWKLFTEKERLICIEWNKKVRIHKDAKMQEV